MKHSALLKIMIKAILSMGLNVTPINFNITKRNQHMRVKSSVISHCMSDSLPEDSMSHFIARTLSR